MEEKTEKRFISMLSDYGFKVTFGNESHPRFLKRALQAIILSDSPIESVSFTKNEATATTKKSRSGLYDMTCTDEKGRAFIVEMQLTNFKEMIQRAKFYAFHRMNTMVRKGKYTFSGLNKIYTISILADKIYDTDLYHQIITLKNQRNELVDDQITHVTIELGKFKKMLDEVESDLDKLLYLMKLTDVATENQKLPDFLNEDWIQETLKELDASNLTPEQRADLEITIAGNVTDRLAREEELKNKEIKTEQRVKKESVMNLLKLDVLTVSQIAESLKVSEEFVDSLKAEIENGK